MSNLCRWSLLERDQSAFGDIAIGGEASDPGRIVISFAQVVTRLSSEESGWPATESDLESVALEVALRFNLAILPEVRIGPRCIGRRKGSIHISGPEAVDAAHAHIVRK